MGWWRRFINDIVFQDFSAQTPLRGFLSSMFENHHHDNPRAQAKGSKDHNTKKVKLLDIHSNPPNGPSVLRGRLARIPLRSAGGTWASTKGPGDAIINGASEGPGGQIWSLLNAVMIWLDITKLSLMMYFSYQIVLFHQLEWLSFSQIWANDASICCVTSDWTSPHQLRQLWRVEPTAGHPFWTRKGSHSSGTARLPKQQ